jgi:hypothetical protein
MVGLPSQAPHLATLPLRPPTSHASPHHPPRSSTPTGPPCLGRIQHSSSAHTR